MTVMAGCVPLDDTHVQVVQPSLTDGYQRNVLNKCDPHIYPHRLFIGQVGMGSTLQQGAVVARNQADFDTYWNTISDLTDENKVSVTMKPTVNFDKEMVYFLPISISNSCQKFEPYGGQMMTDCYDISIVIFRSTDVVNCQPVNNIPVFVYIYPKTEWPIQMQWIDPAPTPTPGS
jgi:hypothetical protein